MPYTYPAVDSLDRKPFIGSGTCVDLVKRLVPGLIGQPTASWRAGENLMDALKAGKAISKGTAIATFKNGRYPQACETGYRGSCHHAGLLLAIQPGGIWIMDQYTGDETRQFVARRFIHIPPPNMKTLPDGSFRNAGNNPFAFYVIER